MQQRCLKGSVPKEQKIKRFIFPLPVSWLKLLLISFLSAMCSPSHHSVLLFRIPTNPIKLELEARQRSGCKGSSRGAHLQSRHPFCRVPQVNPLCQQRGKELGSGCCCALSCSCLGNGTLRALPPSLSSRMGNKSWPWLTWQRHGRMRRARGAEQTCLCQGRQRAKESSGCRAACRGGPSLLPFGGTSITPPPTPRQPPERFLRTRCHISRRAAAPGSSAESPTHTYLTLFFHKASPSPCTWGSSSGGPQTASLCLERCWLLPSFSSPARPWVCSAAAAVNCQELVRSALLLSPGKSLSCCPSKNPGDIECF